MTFTVHELGKAKADKRQIFKWIYGRSRTGAVAWLSAYDRVVERLEHQAETFAEAYESADLDMDVKQALFKTRRGRFYRVLFVIESSNVFILRVRGPGQAPVEAVDIETP